MIGGLKTTVKRVTPAPALDLLRTAGFELHLLLAHRKGVRHARALDQHGLRLNLGSGGRLRPGWVNVDATATGAVPLDLRCELPFLDGSCTTVYSEHFFEHLEFPEPAIFHLSEVFRVLEPGGILSFGVPDTERILREYVAGDGPILEYGRSNWHRECETPMEQINVHFRQHGEHRFAYDFVTLEHRLEQVGFIDVRERPFDVSLDSEDRRLGTLYVEARTPT